MAGGGLAGAAGVLTKLLSLFSSAPSKVAEKCYDCNHTTKNKYRYVPRTEDFIQRSAFLVYIIVLLILSVRGCGINQVISRDTALSPTQPVIHNEWSRFTLYMAILRDGRATAPCEQTNTASDRSKAPRFYRKLLTYLFATLLLAGDVQLNPGPVVVQDLPPTSTLVTPGNADQQRYSHGNPAVTKHFNIGLFQTVQHSKMIWDPCAKPRGLIGGHLNICSVRAKTDQLENLFTDSNLDFLGLSETWLSKSSPVASFIMPGYKVFRKDRNKGRGGGLLMYVRDNIRCKQIDLTCVNELECIAITITLSQQMSFNVIGVYRPPSYDVTFYEHFKRLLKLLDTKKECKVLGDFNLNWSEKATRKKLKALTDKFELTQLIDGPHK